MRGSSTGDVSSTNVLLGRKGQGGEEEDGSEREGREGLREDTMRRERMYSKVEGNIQRGEGMMNVQRVG